MKTVEDLSLTTGMHFQFQSAVPSAPPSYLDSEVKVSEETKKRLEAIYNVAPEIGTIASQLQKQLVQFGLEGHKARVCLILDISPSMENPNKFFSTKKVTTLVNNLLAIACFFDDNYEIEVIPFAGKSYPVQKISLKNYKDAAEQILINCGGLGDSTNYAAPVSSVREYYFKSTDKPTAGPHSTELPVFAIFVTDGDCNADCKEAARVQFRYASQYPVFFKFIALQGQQDKSVFEFLQSIDDAPVIGEPVEGPHVPDHLRHYIDNSDFVVIQNPDDITMADFLKEYPGYLDEAYRVKGLLDRNPSVDASKIKKEGRKESVAAPEQAKACCVIL